MPGASVSSCIIFNVSSMRASLAYICFAPCILPRYPLHTDHVRPSLATLDRGRARSEPALQIGDQILDVLQPDADPVHLVLEPHALPDARRLAAGVAEP